MESLKNTIFMHFWRRSILVYNKNIIDVIDPFPDIFDNFDSLFIYFF